MLLLYRLQRARKPAPSPAAAVGGALLLLALPLAALSQSLADASPESVPATSTIRADTQGTLSEEQFSPYDASQFQATMNKALALQEAGEHEAALPEFYRAWQIRRIEHGLYHEVQIPVLESLVVSELEAGEWEAADRHYDYMAHLYRRLYDIDDPRLEAGLQKLSSFHVNAFNVNLGGRREHHLRKAAEIHRSLHLFLWTEHADHESADGRR